MDNNEVIRNGNNNSQGSNSVSIVSMVLGIVSIVFCWLPIVGLVIGIVAVVLAVNGLKKASIVCKGKGFSIAGLSCGAVGLTLNLVYTIMWLFLGAMIKYIFDEIDYNVKDYNYNYNYNNTYINRTYDDTRSLNSILDATNNFVYNNTNNHIYY